MVRSNDVERFILDTHIKNTDNKDENFGMQNMQYSVSEIN